MEQCGVLWERAGITYRYTPTPRNNILVNDGPRVPQGWTTEPRHVVSRAIQVRVGACPHIRPVTHFSEHISLAPPKMKYLGIDLTK